MLLRQSLRQFVHRPGPTFVIVATLALALGAATVTYSVIDMFRHALPVRDDGRIVFIASTDPRPSQSQAGVYRGVAWTGVSIPDLADFMARTRSFGQFAGFTFGTATLTGTTEPERLRVVRTTANLLPTWRLVPRAGRGFVAQDGWPGAAPVVMLSDRFWDRRYGRSAAIVGRQIMIDGRGHTIVGVLPAAMDSGIFRGTDIALPVIVDPAGSARDDRRLFLTATLASGVGRDQAAAELDTIVRQLQREYPPTNAHTGVVVRPLIDMLGGTAPTIVLFLTIIAAALIAIACANIANVVLAVATSRRQEFAVRRSLGASPRAHVAQLVAEGAALSLVACPLGILAAWAGLKGLSALDPGADSPLSAIDLNLRIVMAAVGMSLAAAIGFALLPALRSARQSSADLQVQSRTVSAPRQTRFLSHALVAIQVGIAVILLVQITSFTRAAFSFVNAPRGFDERGLLTFRLELASEKYATGDAVSRFASDVLARTSSLPGVASAGIINRMPIGDRELATRMAIEGTHPRPEDELAVTLAAITGDYLQTMRVPVLRGRGLARDDVSLQRAVGLVSQTAARRYWPGRDPIGTRISIDALGSAVIEIVGIVGDVRNSDVDQGPAAQVYVPFTMLPSRTLAVIVRTSDADLAALGPSIRREVALVDDTQAVFSLQPMSAVLFEDTAGSLLVASVLGAIGLVALVLAAAGVYGLVAYAVTQRTREIGIRVAVGARPRAVVRMVLMHGARPVVGGALVGAAGAFALAVIAGAAMTEVDFRDPLNYAVVTIALVALGFLASVVPARRAARIDPVVALRAE